MLLLKKQQRQCLEESKMHEKEDFLKCLPDEVKKDAIDYLKIQSFIKDKKPTTKYLEQYYDEHLSHRNDDPFFFAYINENPDKSQKQIQYIEILTKSIEMKIVWENIKKANKQNKKLSYFFREAFFTPLEIASIDKTNISNKKEILLKISKQTENLIKLIKKNNSINAILTDKLNYLIIKDIYHKYGSHEYNDNFFFSLNKKYIPLKFPSFLKVLEILSQYTKKFIKEEKEIKKEKKHLFKKIFQNPFLPFRKTFNKRAEEIFFTNKLADSLQKTCGKSLYSQIEIITNLFFPESNIDADTIRKNFDQYVKHQKESAFNFDLENLFSGK